MKSSILGLWLSGSTLMEDSLQHPQIKYSHEAKQTKQYSLWCFNVFLAIPLQPSLSVAVRGCFLYWAIYN